MNERQDRVPTGTTHDRRTDTRWGHRNLGGPWWLALLLVPLLLAALLTAVRGGDIGDDLRGRALTALKGAGFDGVDVDASGRDLTLSAADGSALSAADADKARDLVADVDGVRVASLGDGLDGAGDGAGAADGNGDEGDQGAGDSESAEPTTEPTDTQEASPSATESSSAAAGGVKCNGLQASIDKALGADFVQFDELHRIPNEASKAELAAVAELIAPCTDLKITVTGYTDKFGSKRLSIARALNVSQILVDGGVTADIRKVGGHFSRELGDNETQAGRDQNRFATITVK
ncbi:MULTISPECIES: OmpA family protein [Nocardioides]|uniref:OmpA family protein n=1 Tax=Nocardioides TaxID=1839 RepID=UPI00032D68D5|nr:MULTISPECIES: OmpA family protein [Nocardioides]EON25194.1 OmpA/MotB domain-containing protein [Nocardioides sp. CF8]